MRPAALQGPGDGQVESFGTRLKREREKRKITLDDISVSTKIATRFLVALEGDQFDQLPGGIFNKGFVRSYARHLGLDENQTIADFVAASEPPLPEIPPEEPPVLAAMAERVPVAARKSEGGIPWGLVAVALLVLAFGFALWGFYSREKPHVPSIKPAPTGNDTSTAAPQPVPDTAAKPASPEATNAASPAKSREPVETNLSAPPAAATNAGAFLVQVKARQDSWVAITADGKQILQETLSAAAEKSIEARDQVVIKSGNVGALDISFNGKKLESLGSYNQVKTLTFDSNGLRP
jgi:cytoskeleton protein RodZ